jgi:hypothetical protein
MCHSCAQLAHLFCSRLPCRPLRSLPVIGCRVAFPGDLPSREAARCLSQAAYPSGATGWLFPVALPGGLPVRRCRVTLPGGPPGRGCRVALPGGPPGRGPLPGRLPIWHRRVALPGGLPGRGRGVALPGDTPGRVTLLGGLPLRRCRVALPGDLPSQGSLPGSPPGLSTHLAARQGALPRGLPISVGGPAKCPGLPRS